MTNDPRIKVLSRELAEAAGLNPCSDGSCMFGGPEGQHTNSGCRCIEHLDGPRMPLAQRVFVRRIAMALRCAADITLAVRDERDAARKERDEAAALLIQGLATTAKQAMHLALASDIIANQQRVADEWALLRADIASKDARIAQLVGLLGEARDHTEHDRSCTWTGLSVAHGKGVIGAPPGDEDCNCWRGRIDAALTATGGDDDR